MRRSSNSINEKQGKSGIKLLRSNEVSRLTGITLRRLQWWDEKGFVKPAHDGHCRYYSPSDLAATWIIKSLIQRGFSNQGVFKLAAQIRRIANTIQPGEWIIYDGKSIYSKGSAEDAIEAIENAKRPMICFSFTLPGQKAA